MTPTKTILFFPLNSPGHVNSSLGIADRFKEDLGFRTVFLILGDPIGNSIKEHGHELILLDEANSHEDYPVSDGEDPTVPVDEELKKQQGKGKKKYPGAFKWPQIIQRSQALFKLSPLEGFIAACSLMEENMVAELIDNHDNYETTIDKINPDLIIIDAYYVPPCIVNRTKCPWVKICSANPLPLVESRLPGKVKPPPMCGYSLFNKETRDKLRNQEPEKWKAMLDEWQQAWNLIADAMVKAGTKLNTFLQAHKCPPLQRGKQSHDSPHLNLYMYPSDVDYDLEDDLFEYPPRWFRVESLLRKSMPQIDSKEANLWGERLTEGMRGKNEMIFFSLGSIASGNISTMQSYIEMFKEDTKRLYVVSKGVNGHKYQLSPENMIGGDYIPQPFFLERADMAIIHGGNNSITECLHFGLPMIVLPVFADQFDNAQRIQDLGLGKRLDLFNPNKEQIFEAISEILSDKKMIEKCRDIGKRLRSKDETLKVTLILKKLAEEKSLDQQFIDDCRNKSANEIKF